MALSSQGYGFDSQNDVSPFVSVGNQTDTPDNITSTSLSAVSSGGAVLGNLPYTLRIQSNLFHDDESVYKANQINSLLKRDLYDRVTRVKEGLLVESMFPDEVFGFPINEKFVENFYDTFLSNYGSLDPANFKSERKTEVFLNRMISTIANFLNATNQLPSFKPLRYFTSAYSDTPLKGQQLKRKPDIILVSLVDGYIPENSALGWDKVHAFIEHTIEERTPQRMPDTITVKSFLTFCSQPDRDFFICLGFNGKGFFIVVTDHVGQIDTDIIPFSNSLIFIRMLMGLAFLPDGLIGRDSTITRTQSSLSKATDDKFNVIYPIFPYNIPEPSIRLMAPSSSSSVDVPFISIPTSSPESSGSIDATSTDSTPVSPKQIDTISVGHTIYKVICVLFKSRTLIGRATTVFLVQLPDKRLAVLKDSWITTDRPQEAEVLQGLDIPFGPQLINHCILRNTSAFRQHAVVPSLNSECRQKRRVVTCPAGVHISDFTCLWELMVAFLDIVIAILHLETLNLLHRDISYTNILLRERDQSKAGIEAREKLMKELGLSEIEELRKRLGCREGLLIDFDYAASLLGKPTASKGTNSEEKKREDPLKPLSGTRTGTPPFIAMELLIFGLPHRVAHDLESLYYVLIFICTHLGGPDNTAGDPPLYGEVKSSNHPSAIKQWLCATNLVTLGKTKFGDMVGFFEHSVLPYISSYFKPLEPHLSSLWDTILPQRSLKPPKGMDSVHSDVTCHQIIAAFKTILMDSALIAQAERVDITRGKRSLPGDLEVSSNGWDVVRRPSKKQLMKPPNIKPPPVRTTKLMTKGQKSIQSRSKI